MGLWSAQLHRFETRPLPDTFYSYRLPTGPSITLCILVFYSGYWPIDTGGLRNKARCPFNEDKFVLNKLYKFIWSSTLFGINETFKIIITRIKETTVHKKTSVRSLYYILYQVLVKPGFILKTNRFFYQLNLSKFCFCQWKKQPRIRVYVFVMFVAENRKAIRVPEWAIGGVATSLFSSSITLAVSVRVSSTQCNKPILNSKTHSNQYFQYQCKFIFAIWVYHLVRFEILTIFRYFWILYDLQQYYVTLLFALKV